MLDPAVRSFLADDVLARFLRYVQVHTTSDDRSVDKPSTPGQMELLRKLADECRRLELADLHLSDHGFLYATLPARPGHERAEPFCLLAHVDTSPEQPGAGVRPRCHANWDGSPISFPDDPTLTLGIEDSPELADFVGDTIVTASGTTLLGADDKAGIAEILAAVATLRSFPQLPHGEIRICFTSDEEIGRGTEGLELERLPHACYTMDGSYPGDLQAECFNAWRAELAFHGVGVHPAEAYGKMVNAAVAAARFVAALPAAEAPEHTRDRAGFYYVFQVSGDCEQAHVALIVRDFEREQNVARCQQLAALRDRLEQETPGLRIELEVQEQYRNMREGIAAHPQVLERAREAIRDTGLTPREAPIRGGTDGSLLTQLGHPTPNVFAGGLMAHSRREWVAARALAQATETILHLARRWSG